MNLSVDEGTLSVRDMHELLTDFCTQLEYIPIEIIIIVDMLNSVRI